MSRVDNEGVQPTLLVIHRGDDDARAILDEVAAQVELGNATQHLRILIDSSTREDSALWSAEVVRSDGMIEEHPLFDYLSRIGTKAMLRFVAVCAKPNDPLVAADLNARMRNLRERMPMLLGVDHPRTQARVAIVGYGDQQVDKRFFSALADANLSIMPLDRLEDSSIARPVQRDQVEAFHVHGAVELISVTGLWRTMGDAPIDHLRGGPAGGGDPRVRLVQSRMRLLRTPAVPIEGLVSEDRDLPMPDGFLPATNAAERIGRAAEQLLPPELEHRPSEAPRPERQQISTKDLALIVGRELLSAFVELPRLIWRVAGGQVSSLTRRVLQEAVGSESRYRVLTDDDDLVGESREAQAHRYRMSIEQAIASIMADESLVSRVDPVPGELWTSLISETLGMLDGDPECSGLREEAFGDAAFLPLERSHLLSGLHRLPEGVRRLAGVATSDAADDHVATPVVSKRAKDLDPPESPSVGRLTSDGHLGRVVRRDALRLDLIRAAWSAITASSGSFHKNADVTYSDSWPYDLTGDVLTVRFPAGRAKYSARRAASQPLTEALLGAISQKRGDQGAPSAVRVIIEGGEDVWEREFTGAALGELLGLDSDRVLAELKTCGIPLDSAADRVSASRIVDVANKVRALSKAPAFIQLVRDLVGDPGGPYFIPGALPIDDFARLHDLHGPQVPAPVTTEATPSTSDALDLDLIDPEGAEVVAGDGLLMRIRNALLKQVVGANQDIRRLLGVLRQDQITFAPLTIQRSVPVGAGIGFVLLFIIQGLSGRVVGLLQAQEVSVRTLDLWFTLSTLLILALALFLTEIGKSMGDQTRIMVFGAGTIGIIAYVLLYFDRLRFVVSAPLRANQSFAVLLGILTVGFVVYAATQSFRSGSALRIQGSRVLGAVVVAYGVLGFVFLQSRPGSWWDGIRQEEFGRRLSWAVMVVALSLIAIAIIVITVVRLRESRRLDNSREVDDWALRALADAVEARAMLQFADRQWLATLPTLAQVIRQPFGPIDASQNEVEVLGASTVLKSASVRLTLSNRGLADLEARVRQELVSTSWLRSRYEAMVGAYQEFIATRSAVEPGSLDARRPEGDASVPSLEALESGQGPGDRLEFANLVAAGTFDRERAQPLEQLDVAKIFQPMLANQEVQVLEGLNGRSGTVRDYFEEVLPKSGVVIPDGIVSTALAANEQARRMRTFVWWPEPMLGEAIVPKDADVEHRLTELFRRGFIGGAGLVAVRVDVSGEFAYSELVGAVVASDDTTALAAEDEGAAYEGTSGL